jgi:putative transposase
MPRTRRIRLADTPFHLVQRGHNRGACFLRDEDRHRYLAELTCLSREHGVAVHSYVLMTNHVHLLATARQPDGISTLMWFLGLRYVRYFNASHGRTGSLWEGRPYASPIDAESHLLVCHRYIESNPVRAGMVPHPEDYAWSSYRANACGKDDPLVSRHPALEALGETPAARRAAYRSLFDVELAPEQLAEIRLGARGGFAVGGPAFKRRLGAKLQRRVGRLGSGYREHAPVDGTDPAPPT